MAHSPNPEIVILGAGMAGLAAAYHLAVRQGINNIVVVDELEPLGLTSSRGTMAYRNWFPGPGDAMVRLLNRSIDLFQEIDQTSDHAIKLSQNGYMYLTALPAQADRWRDLARDVPRYVASVLCANITTAQPIFRHPSLTRLSLHRANGADLIINPDALREFYPCVTSDATALLHVRRCGALDVSALGAWLVAQAQAHGVQFLRDRVVDISIADNRIRALRLASGASLSTRTLVLAAGPLLPQIAGMLDLQLPIYNELHFKLTLDDSALLFPRDADLILWNDPQLLEWDDLIRAAYASSVRERWLLEPFPGGVHYLPKGTPTHPKIMALWTYDVHETEYREPPQIDPHYAELVLRGLARMIPRARAYFGRARDAFVDGGYYCKTRENRPLIGPLPIQGAYIIGALSGFGVMSSQGAAELLAAHLVGATLPEHAKYFVLSRYDDPAYRALLDSWDVRTGQL